MYGGTVNLVEPIWTQLVDIIEGHFFCRFQFYLFCRVTSYLLE